MLMVMGTPSSFAAGPPPAFFPVDLPNRIAYPVVGAVADINSDAYPDILVGADTGLFVLPGNGSDYFSACYQAADDRLALRAIFTADFNRDGRLDAIVRADDPIPPDEGSIIRVFLGEAGGRFQASFGLGPAGPGVGRGSPSVGDFNGDGLADFLVCNYYYGGLDPRVEIVPYLGDGIGGFAVAAPSVLPSGPCGRPGYGGDLNGDGRTDLATRSLQSVRVWLTGPAAAFEPPALLPAPTPPSDQVVGDYPHPLDIVAGDLNGDGRRDLLVRFDYIRQDPAHRSDPDAGKVGGFSAVYFGDGSGQFAAPARLPESVGFQRGLVNQVIADLNRDGRDDVVLTSRNPFTSFLYPYMRDPKATEVYLANGAGSFGSPILSPDSGGSFPYGSDFQDQLPDVDGDGLLDLVTVRHPGLNISRGDGTGRFGPGKPAVAFDSIYAGGVAVADFNGDGHADIAVANSGSANVSIWLGDGSGGWSGPTTYQLSDYETPLAIVAADLNADGLIDLATASIGVTSILHGDGQGRFALARRLSDLATAVAAADFDGDGSMDLAFAEAGGRSVGFYFDIARQGIPRYFHDPDDYLDRPGITAMDVADIDRSGLPDVAIIRGDDTGVVSVLLNPGDFGEWVRVPMGLLSNLYAGSVSLGDIDGNGAADLAVIDYDWDAGAAIVVVARGDDRGGFLSPERYPLPGECSPQGIGIADLDGRGQRAIVVHDTNCGLLVLPADSAGRLGSPSIFRKQYAGVLRKVILADVNHDGLLDVVRPDAVFMNLGGCSNGRLEPSEECDDGNNTSCDGCSATCRREIGALCGDGIVNSACGEECDAGGLNSDTAPNACRTSCRNARCRDAVPDNGEACDDGNTNNCDGCSSSCTLDPAPICGDGIVNTACREECEDGNTTDGDGCSQSCRREFIPGGGWAATDCFAEWVVVNPNNSPKLDRSGRLSAKQTCRDNDPSCDFDGGVSGTCTFHVTVCANVNDLSLRARCEPATLASYSVMMPSARDAGRSPVTAAVRTRLGQALETLRTGRWDECAPTMEIPVPLLVRSASKWAGRRILLTNVVSDERKRDLDMLIFVCTP